MKHRRFAVRISLPLASVVDPQRFLRLTGLPAMALAYDARRVTRDIGAVFQPHGVVLEEARAVAAELGLPNWWLNEQASAYVARGEDRRLVVPYARGASVDGARRALSWPARWWRPSSTCLGSGAA